MKSCSVRSWLLMAGLLIAATGAPRFAAAKPWWARGVDSNDTDFLPPEVAFRVAAHIDGGVVRVRYRIADGYYLYRQKMEIAAESPGLLLGVATYPAGMSKTDPYLGTQEIFTGEVVGSAPFKRVDAGAHPIEIKVTYQGCASAGLCYPPLTKVLFPSADAVAPVATGPGRAGYAIVLGLFAFLTAGLVLRDGRRVDLSQ